MQHIDTYWIKNASFKHLENKFYTIKNIPFKIASGVKISIVWVNESEKSTCIKLLLSLYEPTEGEIFINEINIKNYRK